MVCYMYYTDVFVGTVNNIEKLNKALDAELKGSELNDELETQLNALAEGLKSFIGYSGGVLSGNGIGKSGGSYKSSYDSDKAKWNLLCSPLSGSPCSGCLPSCLKCPCRKSAFLFSDSHGCPDGGCCEKCPKRLCAKIFLGFLPCLYYGLKILWVRCKNGSSFAGWHDISILSGKPESALAKFLFALGYDVKILNVSLPGSSIPGFLNPLFNSDSKGSFDKIYDFVSEKYFTSSSSGSQDPSTVRSMLLWLYGLRFHKHFSDLVENSKSLCSPFGKSFNADAFCYYIHTCCFILPVAIISFIEDSSSALSLISSSSDWKDFSYPEDLSSLFEKLCEYARKIFVALKFLQYQCNLGPSQAGWQSCYFGGSCKKALEGSLDSGPKSTSPSCSSCKYSGAYLCTGKAYGTDAHDHCKDGQTCLGFGSSVSCSVHPPKSGSCSNPCPHPLQRFLTATSDSESYPFGLSDIVPMGFSKENLSSTARDGWSLYHVIEPFCESGFYPLTRLVQFILCISQRPPESLFDLYAFFKKFVSSNVFKNNFVQWINGEPGTYDGQKLKKALEDLYGSQDSHSGSSHSANLFSLVGCHANKGSGSPPTCGPYLYPLTDKASGVFTKELCGTYLSWICHLTKDFKEKLKEFQGEFSSPSCCPSSSGSCQKIVECPCALPKFYKYGFAFASPNSLNCVDNSGQEHGKHGGQGGGQVKNPEQCTRKTCSDFIAQLGKVLGLDPPDPSTPLSKLLEEIPKFIWSIRFPFFLFVLAFWAFVISYFLYVHLYHLDLLELNSHDHPAWSFKIPPSILFSDASSKLKDLSYFTL
ncbi:variant erythrocyte surface antigen-1 family protein [Babesia divergens]|uniref:Variant erythrocyte surface antigen-1 family protein n=1 Tax=Babesia divergens TaxID=32595 RepID=A0AAD9GIJ3_BABDI|nr:variant erythrocyte surface antigen-1 family protein [Babesia divergens]